MKTKYVYSGMIFLIIFGSAIAFNNNVQIINKAGADLRVDFTFNNDVCSGEYVTFNSAVLGDTSSLAYNWSFGDGKNSSDKNPSLIFESLGCGTKDYKITLKVTDNNGKTATKTHILTVQQKPDISFIDINPGAAGAFDNCGSINPSSQFMIQVGNTSASLSCITSYDINWGDGTNEQNVSFPISHNYLDYGSYDMKITAIGANDCKSTKSYSVRNATNPSGGISGPGDTQNLCTPSKNIQFEITNWGRNTSDTTYEVDYGDGAKVEYTQAEMVASAYYNAATPSASLPFPIRPHSYTKSSCPDEYVAKLWIRNACAPNPNPATLPNILIITSPEAKFTAPEEGCTDLSIPFSNISESFFGFNCSTNDKFTWDFGDGSALLSTNGIQDVAHIFTKPGTYKVTLTADNAMCDPTNYSKLICITPPLIPQFSATQIEGCAPFTTILNNTTNEDDQCNQPTYKWLITYKPEFCGTVSAYNFINATNANSQQPEIEFLNPGIYEVILQGTNSCGTTGSALQQILVKAPPRVAIDGIPDFCDGAAIVNPSANVSACGPGPVTYSWNLSGGASPIDWEFINGTNKNSVLPEIQFHTLNTYNLSLKVSTECGTISSTEEFVIAPVAEMTNVSRDQLVCSGGMTSEIIFESDDPNTTFEWSGVASTGNISGTIPSGSNNTIPAHTLTLNEGTTGTVVYTVTPYLVSSCPGNPITFTINVNQGPAIKTQPEGAAYCLDAVSKPLNFSLTDTATGAATYQWYYNNSGNSDPASASTFAVTTSEGIQADFQPPTDIVGTLYYFAVISFSGADSCGEISTTPVPITVTPNVIIKDETPLNQVICSGANPTPLRFTVNDGGAGKSQYKWYRSMDANIDPTDTPVGTNDIFYDPGVLTPGTYYYYAIVDVDETLGCSDASSALFSIEVVEDPQVTITPEDQFICTNVSANVLVAQASGGIDITNDGLVNNQDYQFQWYLNGKPVSEVNDLDGDVSTFNHNPNLPAGVYRYYCEISQPNNLHCNAVSNTVAITVNEGPSIASQPIGAEFCLGDAMAALEVVINNGVGTPEYQWYVNETNDTNTPQKTGTNSSTLVIPNTGVGVYYYYSIITFSEGGCEALISEIVPVIINQVPEISNFIELICSNNMLTVVPDTTNGDIIPTNTTYTWSTPSVIPAGAITGASEQTAPVTSISQHLENTTLHPATVTYMVRPQSEDCAGEIFEVVVIVNPSISVTTNAVINTCFESNDASIEMAISGGVPFASGAPYKVTWTGPHGFTSTSKDIYNLEKGTYVVDITDEGGCPYSETFDITEPEDLEFSFIDFNPETISCFGAHDGSIAIDITGGTLPYDYNWTKDGLPFSNREDLSDLGPGIYEITVTDANRCGPITKRFTVEEPPLLVISPTSQTDVLCYGEATGAIAINVSGGRPKYDFLWTGPADFTSTAQNIDNLISGTYTVTVTDLSGCAVARNFVVSQNDDIDITITTTEIECYGDNDASITIHNVGGGVGPYDIAWSNYGTGKVQSNLSAGIYTITITDANNCVKSFPVEIEEAPLFLIEPVVTQMSCAGENDARIVLNFQGGIAPVTVKWDDDATAGVERNNLSPGTYSVIIQDGSSCSIQESFTIHNILPLQLSANVTDALECDDANSGAIDLLISGGTLPYQVVWSNGAVTEDLVNIPANTYNVTVTDANGCVIEGSWNVNRFEPLIVWIDTQTEVDCEAKTVSQSFVAMASGGVPPFQFNWSSGDISGNNNQIMHTAVKGLVILDVTDSLGCTARYSLEVQTPILGDANFEASSFGYSNYGLFSIQDPIQFMNTATGDYESVLWDFGDGRFSSEDNPQHTYLKTGNYVITQTVTYPFGCVYRHVVTLTVEKGYKLILPNAFTPNNDHINDFFGPEHIGLKKLKLNIYDTWGTLIYSESGDAIRGWDGMIKGQEAENGNYYYTFTAFTFYESVVEKKGPFVFIK